MKATLHQVFRATCQFFIEATLFNKPMSPGLLQLQAPDLIFAKHLKHLKAPDNNLQARGLDIKTAEIHHSKAQGLLVLQTPCRLIPEAPHLVFLNAICLVMEQAKYPQVSWAIIQLLLKFPGLKILKAIGKMMLKAKGFNLLRDLRLNNLETPGICLPKAVRLNSIKYLFKALVINHLKARGHNLLRTQEQIFLKSEVLVLL
ncbi:hypothetical protein V5799_022971 [Amblyomma americanum]|uniref:Uncharacterized protein n=1 Tax=Amblyomma americanum TaxID=6943 RepID=A0AAQ4FIW1_AMBAM